MFAYFMVAEIAEIEEKKHADEFESIFTFV
jgi:hypothetical protein